MALARSASGPGGLSINTSSANSIFGSSTTPAAAMSTSKPLFGALPTTAATQTGNLFGATTSAATSNLFGATAISQPAAGGLFGSSTTQAAPGLGLFSNPGTTQAAGTGLFGNNTAQSAQGGNLFGSSNNQNQNKPTNSLLGGFGNMQNQQTQQPQAGSGMFNSLLNKPQQPGQSQGFGGPANTGLTLGQSTTNQQQTVPGVRIDIDQVRGTTRFNDLHESIQNDIENMDKILDQQIRMKNDCSAIMPAHDSQLATIPNDVEFCRRKLIGLDAAMSSDAEAIAKLQKLVSTDFEHGKLSFSAIDNLRLPQQYHIAGVWPPKPTSNNNQSQGGGGDSQDIVGYFSSTVDELSATLQKYQKNIGEIELHLRNVESTSAQQVSSLIARRNGASGTDEDAIRELASALADFEQGILHVAGKVGGVREGVQTIQLGAFPDSTTSSTNQAPNKKRSGIY